MIRAILAFALAAYASATCDNACSGHGVCECGFCLCYDNWGMNQDLDTGDCSDRICPFEFAWVDTPDINGRFHKYAECSNRGICNRQTGECECFEGYEGKGCQRTTCPNDCSGHGQCQYIQNLPYANTPFASNDIGTYLNVPTTFDFKEWDQFKTRGCVCDPEYGDIDCSKRICPYGNDMMDRRVNLSNPLIYQTQNLLFIHEEDIDDLDGQTFALTFKSKLNETFTTTPIVFKSTQADMDVFVASIQDALLRLPNRVIDRVEVHGHIQPNGNELQINVTFVGDYVQGPQNLLVVEAAKCGDGCTPLLTGLKVAVYAQNVTEVSLADYNSYECGRRGKCDYESGLCQCFEGFTGASCNACTALI